MTLQLTAVPERLVWAPELTESDWSTCEVTLPTSLGTEVVARFDAREEATAAAVAHPGAPLRISALVEQRPSIQEMDLAHPEAQAVKLTPVECKRLYHLVRNAGHRLPHQSLRDRVVGSDYDATPEYLKVFISRLRSKQPQVVQTSVKEKVS